VGDRDPSAASLADNSLFLAQNLRWEGLDFQARALPIVVGSEMARPDACGLCPPRVFSDETPHCQGVEPDSQLGMLGAAAPLVCIERQRGASGKDVHCRKGHWGDRGASRASLAGMRNSTRSKSCAGVVGSSQRSCAVARLSPVLVIVSVLGSRSLFPISVDP